MNLLERSLRSIFVAVLLVFMALISLAQRTDAALSEDVILQWNRVLGQTLQVPDVQPPTINPVRSFAMMHLAMFDAVNSIDGSYTPYLTDVPGARGPASIKIAAAKAAHDVLSSLYPTQRSVFDAEFAISVDGLAAGRNRGAMQVGEQAAAAILANRANDGWSAPWTPFLLSPAPGNWQELFVGPYPGFAVFTNWPAVRPFALSSSAQFLPPPPPSLSSADYASSLNESKNSVT